MKHKNKKFKQVAIQIFSAVCILATVQLVSATPVQFPLSRTQPLYEVSGLDGYQQAFGFSFAVLSDINQDGVDDFVVGAPYFNEGRGRFQVFSGRDKRVLFTRVGLITDGRTGFSVAGLGDVSGDGVEDFAVSTTNNSWTPTPSFVEIFSGATFGLLRTLVSGSTSQDFFGNRIESIGDLNGDGTKEIAVTSSANSFNGAVHVFSGRSGLELSGSPILAPLNARGFGAALADIGDLNGDGVPEFVIGAPYAGTIQYDGEAYVVNGSNLIPLFSVVGSAHSFQSPRLGSSVEKFRDFDGDGTIDFLVASPGFGEVLLYSGRTAQVIRRLTSHPGYVFPQNGFGDALHYGGDFNRDGLDDLLVYDRSFSIEFSSIGAVYVFSGRDLAIIAIVPGPQPANFAFGTNDSLETMRDSNGDGFDEFLFANAAYTGIPNCRPWQGTACLRQSEGVGGMVELRMPFGAQVYGGDASHALSINFIPGNIGMQGAMIEVAGGVANQSGNVMVGKTKTSLLVSGKRVLVAQEILLPIAFDATGRARLSVDPLINSRYVRPGETIYLQGLSATGTTLNLSPGLELTPPRL